MAGKQGRSGPPGNTHALRTGVHVRLAIPRTGPRHTYARRQAWALRRELERLTAQKHGTVGVAQAAHIQTASVLQQRLAYLAACERDKGTDWTLEQALAVSRETRGILADRDKAIHALDLDRADVIDIGTINRQWQEHVARLEARQDAQDGAQATQPIPADTDHAGGEQ